MKLKTEEKSRVCHVVTLLSAKNWRNLRVLKSYFILTSGPLVKMSCIVAFLPEALQCVMFLEMFAENHDHVVAQLFLQISLDVSLLIEKL